MLRWIGGRMLLGAGDGIPIQYSVRLIVTGRYPPPCTPRSAGAQAVARNRGFASEGVSGGPPAPGLSNAWSSGSDQEDLKEAIVSWTYQVRRTALSMEGDQQSTTLDTLDLHPL